MKYILLVLVIVVTHVSLTAQRYITAGGMRIGKDVGFSVVQKIVGKTTIEVAFQPGFFTNQMNGQTLLRRHYPLISKRLNFFLGAGFAINQSDSEHVEEAEKILQKGLCLQAGSEITIGRCNLSVDYMPIALKNKIQDGFQWSAGTSVSLRYVFWKRPSRISKMIKKR